MSHLRQIALASLRQGLPALTEALGRTFEEACIVCLEHQQHITGVEVQLAGSLSGTFQLIWVGQVTDQMRRAWNDEPYTTEQAAYGIAILVMLNFANYTVIEKAHKSTGIDFYLGQADADPPFQNAAKLEVSGIREGRLSEVRTRVKRKLRQTEQGDDLESVLPVFVVVVEFGQPFVYVEQQ